MRWAMAVDQRGAFVIGTSEERVNGQAAVPERNGGRGDCIRRRTPLEPNAPKEDYPIAPQDLPADWAHITLEIGRVFDLRLYGVDLLMTDHGPMIVDVNSFPGFRGVPGADDALVALVERLGNERNVAR